MIKLFGRRFTKTLYSAVTVFRKIYGKNIYNDVINIDLFDVKDFLIAGRSKASK